MRIRGSLLKGLLIALAIALIPVSAVSAQKITPGSTCKVYKQKVTNQNKVFTCIKSGKKLVWNKGVAVKKPTPTPTPSATKISRWTQVSPMVIKGVASPGQILTVEGGEWTGPTTTKPRYYWHLCVMGEPEDFASGYSANPVYIDQRLSFTASFARYQIRPTLFCGIQPGVATGTTFRVPQDLGMAVYITVSQYLSISEREPYFGYYSYAKGVSVTTNGLIGSPPHVRVDKSGGNVLDTVRVCKESCQYYSSNRYPKKIDSQVGQWFDPQKPKGKNRIYPTRSWYLCPSANYSMLKNLPSDCTLSPRSTTTDLYEITAEDSGKHLRVCATATNNVGTRTQCSGTYLVGIPVSNIEIPKLQGLNRVGSTLTLSRGTWAGSPVPEVFAAWYSCDANGYAAAVKNPQVSGERLDSTTTSYENRSPFLGCLFRQIGKDRLSYTIVPEDSLRIILVLVTASNGFRTEGFGSDGGNDYLSYYLSMNQPVE